MIYDIEMLIKEFLRGFHVTRNNDYVFSNSVAIEAYKKVFSFFSPNVKRVKVNSKHSPIFPNLIVFDCERYVGNDLIFSQVVFDFEFNVLKINNYEKQYLNKDKKCQ